MILPALSALDKPVLTDINPADSKESPVLKLTEPESEETAGPICIATPPLDPTLPEDIVPICMLPLAADVLPPLLIETTPPV